jgi:phosphoglycolate phosphatase
LLGNVKRLSGGFYAVGVTWGFRDMGELLENGADLIIDTPLQILNII